MDKQEAIKALVKFYTSLQTLNRKYECEEGTMQIGFYTRLFLNEKAIKEAIQILNKGD